jgi:hypothetical protein
MYIAGLILTLVGWLFQGYETFIRKTHRINIFLPGTYFVACVLFGVNSLQTGEILFGVLDILIAIIVAIIVVFLFLKK